MAKNYNYNQRSSKRKLGRFQREEWEIRSELDGLMPVLNPSGGVENFFIDKIHKIALSKNINFHGIKKVLDLGCGIGRITRWIAEKADYVIGIDISPGMLLKANNNLKYKNICFVRYNGEKFPFRSNTIDLVISVGVLQHILLISDLKKIISEIKRILTIDGKVCIIEQISKSPTTYGMPDDYVRQRLPEEYKEIFSEYGLELKKWEIVRIEEKGKWEKSFIKLIRKFPLMSRGVDLFTRFQFQLNRKRELISSNHYDCIFMFEKKIF